MPLVMDPAGNEIRALEDIVDWKGRRVLEIGCGDGRLTQRLTAFAPAHIEAIDPDRQRIGLARKSPAARDAGRVAFHTGHAEKLRYPAGTFDIVVFAWSL